MCVRARTRFEETQRLLGRKQKHRKHRKPNHKSLYKQKKHEQKDNCGGATIVNY